MTQQIDDRQATVLLTILTFLDGHPCKDGCQYAKDVDMWPEHRCFSGCKYDDDAESQAIWDQISPRKGEASDRNWL